MGITFGPWMALFWWVLSFGLMIDFTWRRRNARSVTTFVKLLITAALLGLFAIAVCFSFRRAESPLARWTLPGFSTSFAVVFHEGMVNRPQYLFEFRTSEGARAALFLAGNGTHFTFEVRDIHGETHSLDSPVAEGSLKIEEPIILVAQLGVSDTASYMQIVSNGEDVAHETIDFPMDLGSKDWAAHGTILADNEHENFAPFSVSFFSVAHTTWTNSHYVSHTKNLQKLLNDLQVTH